MYIFAIFLPNFLILFNFSACFVRLKLKTYDFLKYYRQNYKKSIKNREKEDGVVVCCRWKMAPEAGIEPATCRLTAGRSTAELLRNGRIVRACKAEARSDFLRSIAY